VVASLFATVPLLVMSAHPAGAALDDPCQATGTIKGVPHNPETQDTAKIPRKGTVAWEGSVPGSGKRDIEGKVYVKIGPASVNVGTWSGPSDTYKNNGTYKYKFPSVLVGLKVPVWGHHADKGFTCNGHITVELAGSKLGNPILLGSLALTVLSVVNLSLSVRAKRVGR
jgi:hypothetical protein